MSLVENLPGRLDTRALAEHLGLPVAPVDSWVRGARSRRRLAMDEFGRLISLVA
jgi:hypothetical protein